MWAERQLISLRTRHVAGRQSSRDEDVKGSARVTRMQLQDCQGARQGASGCISAARQAQICPETAKRSRQSCEGRHWDLALGLTLSQD